MATAPWHQTFAWALPVVPAVLLLFVGLLLLVVLLSWACLGRELERRVALRTHELEQETVELREAQRKLEQMAYTDPLTHLPNRRMFDEHFKRLLAIKQRQQGSFVLVLVDFDGFKEINDTYGHGAGDAVLSEMGARMTAIVRLADCLARIGGDEFGLLLADTPTGEGLEFVCGKIVASFECPVLFRGVPLRTTPSIGVAIFPEAGDSQEDLYKAADLNLYQSKRQGGNCWTSAALSEA